MKKAFVKGIGEAKWNGRFEKIFGRAVGNH